MKHRSKECHENHWHWYDQLFISVINTVWIQESSFTFFKIQITKNNSDVSSVGAIYKRIIRNYIYISDWIYDRLRGCLLCFCTNTNAQDGARGGIVICFYSVCGDLWPYLYGSDRIISIFFYRNVFKNALFRNPNNIDEKKQLYSSYSCFVGSFPQFLYQ